MAVRTERIRLGTLVTPLARRRPWVVAKHVTTLDHLSDGRAVLGVGIGEPSDADFADFGDPGTRKERAVVLDDALALTDALLRGPVSHHSPAFDVEAELRPRPVQQPRPPIWVAAMAPHRAGLERSLRWDGVAALDMPNGWFSPQGLADYLDGVERPAYWDVVVESGPGIPADEYADAGATWLFISTWPEADWPSDLHNKIRHGPNP